MPCDAVFLDNGDLPARLGIDDRKRPVALDHAEPGSKPVSARGGGQLEPAISAMDKLRRCVVFMVFSMCFFKAGETAFIANWACEGYRGASIPVSAH